MIRNLAFSALILLSACAQPAPDPTKADGYAMTLPVKPSEEEGVHRIELPPIAVAALQRDDVIDDVHAPAAYRTHLALQMLAQARQSLS